MDNETVKKVLGRFIESYAEKDENTDFSAWLSGAIREQLTDITESQSSKMAAEIIEGVSNFDNTLDEVSNSGCSAGEWLEDKVSGLYSDMPPEEAGKKLCLIESGYNTSIIPLIGQAESESELEYDFADPSEEYSQWNEDTIRAKAGSISSKAVFAVLSSAGEYDGSVSADISGEIINALQNGMQADPAEIKAAVAGAVKVAAVNKLSDYLPEDVPMATICDMAGAAVEGANVLFDLSNEKITADEAVDKIGKTAVAAGANYCRYALEDYVGAIPVAGPILTDLFGGLFEHMSSSGFVDNVYRTVKDAAKATWEGMKKSKTVKSIKKAVNKIKNVFHS